jgi:hypothetical protein
MEPFIKAASNSFQILGKLPFMIIVSSYKISAVEIV